jgi:hypothetical protein
MKRNDLKNMARESFVAVLFAAWVVGLVSQFGSWPLTAFYVAISLLMLSVKFVDRRVLDFALRRNRRR